MSQTLMDYGIAVNFFGNYAKEANTIDAVADKIYHSFETLKHVVIGAGITTALYKFGSSLLHTSQELEGVYATLLTVFGSKNRVLEHFKEAREFVAKNPILDLEQIHHATEQLALAGQAKTGKQTTQNLQYLGDFAMGKNMNISDAIQAAVNAGNGNWEMLRNRGFDNRNLKTTAMNAHGTFVDSDGKTKEKSTELLKLADALSKAKVGTDAYKESVIKFLGIYEAGGMQNASKTITGALRASHNLINIFKMEIVGMTQEVGTLSNTIGETLGKAIGKFTERTHKIENIGRGVGQVLIGVWDMIDGAIQSSTDTIVHWIDKLDKFFADYKNNIAPIILFLFLVRLEIELFLKGFYDGFSGTFKWFIGAIVGVYKAVGTFIQWLGLSENASQSLGKAVGILAGLLLGIKAFKFAMSPFQPLITSVMQLNGHMRTAMGMISMGEGWSLKDSVMFRFMQAGDMVNKMSNFLRLATVQQWLLNVATYANPIGLIVLAVIALVAWIVYLVVYWDEVQKKMQGVSDIALVMLAIFMPIVGLPLLMAKYWEELKQIVSNVWRGITGFVKAWWLWIKYEVLIPLSNFFSAVWEGVKNKASQFFNYILAKFPFLMVFVNAFKTAWEGVKSIFDSVWGFFVKIYDKIVNSDFIKTIMDMGVALSDAFGDSGENAYKENLMKYEPDKYEELYGKNNEKKYDRTGNNTATSTTSTTTQTETYHVDKVEIKDVKDGKGFYKGMKDQVKAKGKG